MNGIGKLFLLLIGLIFYQKNNGLSAQTYVHIITDRDDIYKLASIYDVTPYQIAKINGLDSITTPLLRYQKVIIPDKNYKPNKSGYRYIKKIKHKIAQNESLYTIARQYGVTVYDILMLNPNLERGKPLEVNSELKIQVTVNSKSQYSTQIIYLNGEKIHFDSFVINTQDDMDAAKRLNEDLTQRIKELNDITPEFGVLDSLILPSDDTTRMSRLIYHLIKYSQDTSVNKQLWLDSLYEELFYVHSEIKNKPIQSNKSFVIKAFSTLYELTLIEPNNDYYLSMRGLLYYWLRNKQKAEFFADETLSNNSYNQSASILKACLSLEAKMNEKAIAELKNLPEAIHSKNFFQYDLATAYYYKMEFVTAIELYSKLLPNCPEMRAEIDYRIGHCYILIGDDDNGCEYLRESEKMHYAKGAALRARYCK